MIKAYGVTSTFWYCFCRVFGHDMAKIGVPIFHRDGLFKELVEQDRDCMRCGLKGTSVLPYDASTAN